jgi:hypothetical protein
MIVYLGGWVDGFISYVFVYALVVVPLSLSPQQE